MIEPFCSEYIKSYRSHDREPEVEGTKPCSFVNDLAENFLPTEDSKTIYNPERDESVIKELHLKSFVSTYQASYCANVGKKSLVIDPNDLEADQFMVYFNKYYGPRAQPVPRPLDTSRRLLGYSRFSTYYTGKTEYEETISRESYNYFKRDYDLGKSRLFGKKQQALKKLKEEKEPEAAPLIDRKEPEAEIDETADETNPESPQKVKTCMFCCEKYEDPKFNDVEEDKN